MWLIMRLIMRTMGLWGHELQLPRIRGRYRRYEHGSSTHDDIHIGHLMIGLQVSRVVYMTMALRVQKAPALIPRNQLL
jgi:hypothetical protein